MIYHANAEWLPGGFLSVNVFFVLSGYLITGILLRETERWGSIDLVSFYKNRARRLLPALLVLIVAVTAIGSRLLTDAARGNLRGDAIATLFYVANWRFISQGESYFSFNGDPSPFRHIWTLAIEEQFYLIFPILLIALIRLTRGRRRSMARWLMALVAVSVIWQAWVYTHDIATMPNPDPSRIYYGTDTRANELLLGAALAVAMTYWDTRRLKANAERLTWGAIAAFVAMLAFFLIPNESSAWIFLGGGFVFTALITLMIVAVEVWPTSIFAEVLSWRPFTYVGEISYGLYLWHWPLFVFLNAERTGLGEIPLLVVRLVLTFALAAFSYRFIEQPVRTQSLQRRLGRTRAITAWSLVIPVVLAAVLVPTNGIAQVTDAKAGQAVAIKRGDPNAPGRVEVIGDSVGYGLAAQFPTRSFPKVHVDGNAKVGCGTAYQWLVVNGVKQSQDNPDCRDVLQYWGSATQAFKPQVVVWSMGGWDVYDHFINGKVLTVGSPQYAAYYRARLEAGLKEIGPNTPVFIPLVPCYNAAKFVVEGQDLAPNRNDPKRAEALNSIITDFAKAHPKQVHTPDPSPWLCPGGRYVDKIDGKKVRMDGVHYTADGTKRFWRWLMPQLDTYLAK